MNVAYALLPSGSIEYDPIDLVGVQDQFGQSGNPLELIEHYGMGVSHIKAAAKSLVS